MISIDKLRHLLSDIKENVPGISGSSLCVHEGHAVNKLKDKPDIQMLVIYPSANRVGGINEARDENVIWLFILEKDVEGQIDTAEEDQFQKLQGIILKVRDYIEEAAATTACYLQRLDVSRCQIIPEYREFGGWNGWSLSLVF